MARITCGLRSSIGRNRYGAQAAISSYGGWRFSGGRHFTMLQMNTRSRGNSIAARILVRSSPAGPTNGRPVSSSTRPGPSPTTTRRASAGPSPGTVCARPSHSRHLMHDATSSAIAASERACATGSVAKRSPPGGSYERPAGGGRGGGMGDGGCAGAGGGGVTRPASRISLPGSPARITGSPPSSRCCSRNSRASARPSLTSALAPPRRGSCLPRRASAGSAARSARRRDLVVLGLAGFGGGAFYDVSDENPPPRQPHLGAGLCPEVTPPTAPPRRGSCLPRRASAGSAARSARRRDLVVLGLAVFGRAAFHDVADEHALARQLDRGEDLGQEFTRRTDERPAGLVLDAPRPFAHDDETRVRGSLPGDRVRASLAQPALDARRDQFGDRGERARLRHRIGGEEIAAGGVIREARGRKTGRRDAGWGMRRCGWRRDRKSTRLNSS